ncbi:MAG: secretion system protein F [Chloroflexota bacterium]
MVWLAVLIALVVGFGLFLVIYGVNHLLAPDDEVVSRLHRFAPAGPGTPEPPESFIVSRVDQVIQRQGFAQRLARDLARADIKLTAGEFLILQFLTTASGGFAGYLLSGKSLLLGLVGLFTGYFIPRLWLNRRIAARLGAFNSQLPGTIDLLANSLRAGYSLLQAMETVSREAPEPTATEFRRVVREVGLGLSPQEALGHLVRRMQSDDLELMVTAINIQHEVGGNLAQILESIAHTIRERVRIKGEIATLTAQQVVSGYIISALPILLGLVLYLINREYIMGMFEGIFICIPIIGALMIIVAFLIIRRITAIEV